MTTRRIFAALEKAVWLLFSWTVIVNLYRQLSGTAYSVDAYTASQYWLGYEHGFVRRALPGEILSILAGGTPSHRFVQATGLLLSLLAACGLAAMVVRACFLIADSWYRRMVMLAVMSSPLMLTAITHDLGRYDAVGVLCATFFVFGKPAIDRHRWLAIWLGGVVLAVATASEEFLLLFLIPPAVAWFKGRPKDLAVALTPAAVVFLASTLVRPSADTVKSALDRAVAGGLRVDLAPYHNAVQTLRFDFDTEVHVINFYPALNVLASLTLCVSLFYVLYRVLARTVDGVSPSAVHRLGAYLTCCAAALTIIGVDYRRWWALASWSLISYLAASTRPGGDVAVVSKTHNSLSAGKAAVLGLATVCAASIFIGLQAIPVAPHWGLSAWPRASWII